MKEKGVPILDVRVSFLLLLPDVGESACRLGVNKISPD